MISSILQFALTKGIGDVKTKKAIKHMQRTGCTWEELCSSETILMKDIGLTNEVSNNVINNKQKALHLSKELSANNIKLLLENESTYPRYLKEMLGEKCPPILFAKGNISLLNQTSVGFCGSRKVSNKGLEIAYNSAKQLAEHNITVISGYAAGTDLAAHKSALIHAGNTIFVLAEGILKAKIKKEINNLLTPSNHVFISQFAPNITWNAGNAMKRNSVIIGLSHAMILVESGKTGGTFSAGEESLKVGCPLFVIDFAQPEVSAEANPYFILKGGLPIRGKNGVPNLTNVFNTLDDNTRQESQDNYNNPEQIQFSL